MVRALRKWKLPQLVGMALLILSLAACGAAKEDTAGKSADNAKEETPKERILTDAMGHEVKIPANPKRVLASYLEDPLLALGIKPVAQWSVNNGASVQGYLQDQLKDVPTIPYDLPFEAVQKFSPDLIIIDSASMVEGGKYEQYNQIAPTYVIGKEENNDWREELLRVGEIFGKKEKAEKLLDDYEAKVKEAKEKIADAGNPSVAAIWLVNGSFFVVSEKLSSGAVMYEDLGLKVPKVVKEISESGTANWNPISLEKLAELDADYIFLVNSDKANGSPILNNKLWKSIPAVKAGKVYEFSPDESWLYTGIIANEQIIDHILKSIAK
ncbi:putative siderophore-binding lipoprotein YfiY [Anoxybacillus sp. P3H1B]|uniref:iron-hydroxamate ABC transporter substrate-binding protein n=1 Tax=Anoxybacillus sp. P3H1B TaxID=1769293 RepID=UPI000799C9B4|nr:iron-hydroxamate ABC transporter substrate-binding protein [Anoxybacillus sp. P3H1B]KXG08671.1 putative siderophore-binding lipoprotein YfiY [Anoxybacillus sp. P3H1B]